MMFPDISVSQVESNLPGEDRYCVRATADVFAAAVYDGHGGYLACDMACAMLLDMIVSSVQKEMDDDTSDAHVAECIDSAFQQCDDQILKQAVALHRKQVRSFEIARLKESVNGISRSRNDSAKSSTSSNSNSNSSSAQTFLSADGRLLDRTETEAPADAAVAERLLHPAVGRTLGIELHRQYASAQPYDAITIDGLLDDATLRHALDFASVPLSEWVGPEEGAPCCKGKYRLDFDHWNASAYARGLVLLATRPRFIAFLEGLTGIDGLVSMRIQDRRLVSFGSSLIGVTPGGFLTVHNDFNTHAGLYRRLNALLYLNEDWVDAWGGHLELWSGDMTRCVQRIPPLFNRMAIFTVTDDAFHGHPEPLMSPPYTLRYALQLVYYTREPGAVHSDRPGPKRSYNGTHSAVFQPTCSALPGVREFCQTAKRPGDYTDSVACQCNYR